MHHPRVNKHKKVAACLKGSRSRLGYLPRYWPHLYPIKRLWKITQEEKLYNKYYEESVVCFEEIKKFFKEAVAKLASTGVDSINDHCQVNQLSQIKPAC